MPRFYNRGGCTKIREQRRRDLELGLPGKSVFFKVQVKRIYTPWLSSSGRDYGVPKWLINGMNFFLMRWMRNLI